MTDTFIIMQNYIILFIAAKKMFIVNENLNIINVNPTVCTEILRIFAKLDIGKYDE